MKERYLEFTHDKLIEEYLNGIFEKTGIPYKRETRGNFTAYSFLADDGIKEMVICGVILNYFKLRELLKFLPKSDSRAYYALLGALIGLEQDDDRLLIFSGMEGNDIVNIDGYYNFRLNELRENWRNLAKLSAKLYSQCSNDDDVYALAVFMLGMEDGQESTVVISGEELRREKDNVKITVIPFFGEKEPDIITTLLSQRPSDVVVVNPKGVSDGVLSVIRSLGEGGSPAMP